MWEDAACATRVEDCSLLSALCLRSGVHERMSFGLSSMDVGLYGCTDLRSLRGWIRDIIMGYGMWMWM